MERVLWEKSEAVIGAALRVHSELGPGLLESTYEACLTEELRLRGHAVRTQVAVPIVYRGLEVPNGYRIDLLVDEQVIVEVKAVETLGAVHKAQLLTYLKLSGFRMGLLLNFQCTRLRDGIKRLVNGG